MYLQNICLTCCQISVWECISLVFDMDVCFAHAARVVELFRAAVLKRSHDAGGYVNYLTISLLNSRSLLIYHYKLYP